MTAERFLVRRGRWAEVYRTASGRGRNGWRLLAAAVLGRGQLKERRVAALRRAALAGRYETYVDPGRLRVASVLERPPPPYADPRAFMADKLEAGHLAERTAAWAVAGAAHGIRYRYPLLDRRLLAFVLGLPPEVFLPRDGTRRWLARTALRGRVPDAVRRHASKREPARLDAAHGTLRAALERAGAALRTRTSPPPRADWFDYDGLLGALAPERLVEREQFSKLVHALVHLGPGR